MKKTLLLSMAVLCVSCGVGTTSQPTISAVQSSGVGTCGTGITATSCTISITYNSNNNTNLAFTPICSNVVGGSSASACVGTYSVNFSSCPINNSNNQNTCTVTINYTGSGTPPTTSEYIAFTLGSSVPSSPSIALGTGPN